MNIRAWVCAATLFAPVLGADVLFPSVILVADDPIGSLVRNVFGDSLEREHGIKVYGWAQAGAIYNNNGTDDVSKQSFFNTEADLSSNRNSKPEDPALTFAQAYVNFYFPVLGGSELMVGIFHTPLENEIGFALPSPAPTDFYSHTYSLMNSPLDGLGSSMRVLARIVVYLLLICIHNCSCRIIRTNITSNAEYHSALVALSGQCASNRHRPGVECQ